MLVLLTNVRKVLVVCHDIYWEIYPDGIAGLSPARSWGGRPSACHSIPTTFPREIPRKTHTFLTLVNKNNILYSIGVI